MNNNSNRMKQQHCSIRTTTKTIPATETVTVTITIPVSVKGTVTVTVFVTATMTVTATVTVTRQARNHRQNNGVVEANRRTVVWLKTNCCVVEKENKPLCG